MRKMGAKTIVEEELSPNAEIQAEFDGVRDKICAKFRGRPTARRLSFFGAKAGKRTWRDLPEESFLGYAVIIRLKLPPRNATVRKLDLSKDHVYVLEAVTRPPGWLTRTPDGNYLHEGVTNYYLKLTGFG
jgi:hypothetical protein